MAKRRVVRYPTSFGGCALTALFFRTAVGFQTRVNYNGENLFVQYITEPKPKAKIISWKFSNNASMTFNLSYQPSTAEFHSQFHQLRPM